jgi:hypothetical protein
MFDGIEDFIAEGSKVRGNIAAAIVTMSDEGDQTVSIPAVQAILVKMAADARNEALGFPEIRPVALTLITVLMDVVHGLEIVRQLDGFEVPDTIEGVG